MATWNRTSLSTTPALIEMADTDRRGLAIDAGETVTTVTAEIVDLADPATPLTGLIEGTPAINGTTDGAVVIVSGLTRGVLYELSTVFTGNDGEVWTRTTAIRCVA